MDSPTQSSFIPHDAVSSPVIHRGGISELGTLFSVLVLIVSCALAAGVFLYSQYLQSSGKNKLDNLNRAEASIDTAFVQQVTKLDARMHVAQTLLQQHLTPLQVLTTLETSTVQDVAFTSFTYDAVDPKNIKIQMSGVAGSVNAIALQAQIFTQGGVVTNPIFSGIDRQQDGVHFTFTASINPTSISYENLVSGAASAPATQTQTAPQSGANVFDKGGAAPAASQPATPGT